MDRRAGGRRRLAAVGHRSGALVATVGTRHPGPLPRGGALTAAAIPAEPIIIRAGASARRAAGMREVWRFRELLYFLVWRDVKVRYKQTVLGVAWALIQPLMTMV